MGVRGLTTHIAENSEIYLQPYELCDTYLVVDGSNVAAHLYQWLSKGHSAFGGDYDEYYKIVSDFFLLLKKCEIKPIVLFDGGYERRKLKTLLSRSVGRLPILRGFTKGFNTTKFFPLFMKQTFFDVMTDLKIYCVQCDLEADFEIAAIARGLNCPVLSYDSDFYIFDVLYIPFSTVHIKPVKFKDSEKFYVKCSLFNVTNFLKEFSGLDRSLLPVSAILLGNDYIKSSLFQNFFSHILVENGKRKSRTQKRIQGILNWLKKESVESATKLIVSHLENRNAGKVLQEINTIIKDYRNTYVSSSVRQSLEDVIGNISLRIKDFDIKLPEKIVQLYTSCRIHKMIIDMLTLQSYFTQLQVEDVHFQSSHLQSMELIKEIYLMLTPYMRMSKPLKVFLTVKNNYSSVKLETNRATRAKLDEILKESKRKRLKRLCHIVGFNECELHVVSNNNWSIFYLAFLYWLKTLNDRITVAHVHAIIIMAIANQVVQKWVGYFRNYSKFIKSKKNLLDELKNECVVVKEAKNFTKMLENVTPSEKLRIQSILIPYRQTTEKGASKAYNITTLHLFGCFQSCLYHIMQVNALLNYPLPHFKISDFYSGTLLFNLYLIIRSKPEVENFGLTLFKDSPNLAKIYIYLYECLDKYSDKSVKPPEECSIQKKKKRRKKKSSKKNKTSAK